MSIDAMKLALDALDPRLGMPEPEYESLLRCALGELRAAIEQAEKQEPVA
jgi:predicted GTPase